MLYFYLVFGSLAGLIILFGQRAAKNARLGNTTTSEWYVVNLEKVGPWLASVSKNYLRPLVIALLLGAGRIARRLTNAIEANAKKRMERLGKTDGKHQQEASTFLKDVSQLNRPKRT